MTHIWLRAEQRDNETRVGLTPDGAAALLDAGFEVSVEASDSRCIATEQYKTMGCEIVKENSWPQAPHDAIVFGLKELPEDDTPLVHSHIMFGHAYKGQGAGQRLLERFKSGGGALLDLEYLLDPNGRRVAAFGYWAGYAGAAVGLMTWIAQQRGNSLEPVQAYSNKTKLIEDIDTRLSGLVNRPSAIIIGAKGRVGTGAADLLDEFNCEITRWDMAETAHGGPFPEILEHDLFLNCILARPGTPVFVPETAKSAARSLTVIGDVACDPDSAYNPIPVYDRATTWDAPALRVYDEPPLDVMAIDNLPSMLPLESSQDFAEQLLPSLLQLGDAHAAVWSGARDIFRDHIGRLG